MASNGILITYKINYSSKYTGVVTYSFLITFGDKYFINQHFTRGSNPQEEVYLHPGNYQRQYAFNANDFIIEKDFCRAYFRVESETKDNNETQPLYEGTIPQLFFNSGIEPWKWSQTVKVDGVSYNQPIAKDQKVFVKKVKEGEYNAYYLNASEWKIFQDQINKLLVSFGIRDITFLPGDYPSPGEKMSCKIINKVINVFNRMDNSTGLTEISPNSPLSASLIMKLEQAFNSIRAKVYS